MLLGRRTAGLAFVLLASVALLALCSACAPTKGSIVILESPDGRACTMTFREWSASNKCELSLRGGEVLQVEVTRESGEIGLTVSGKKGDEPYIGNRLESGIFTITVHEADEYVIRITGDRATGSLNIKNLGTRQSGLSVAVRLMGEGAPGWLECI